MNARLHADGAYHADCSALVESYRSKRESRLTESLSEQAFEACGG